MQVQFWMTPDPIVVQGTDTIGDAKLRLQDLEVRHLPVMRSDRLIGIISDRDVIDATGDRLLDPVSEVMTESPITVGYEDELVDAARTMLANKISGVPVVKPDGTLLGMLTTTNCLVALIQLHHEREIASM